MRLEGGAAVLAVGCCVCWLVAVTQVTGAAEVASGGVAGLPTGSLMLRPQRPSQFRHEGEVKAYLQRLRDWVEDSMRNNARYIFTLFSLRVLNFYFLMYC